MGNTLVRVIATAVIVLILTGYAVSTLLSWVPFQLPPLLTLLSICGSSLLAALYYLRYFIQGYLFDRMFDTKGRDLTGRVVVVTGGISLSTKAISLFLPLPLPCTHMAAMPPPTIRKMKPTIHDLTILMFRDMSGILNTRYAGGLRICSSFILCGVRCHGYCDGPFEGKRKDGSLCVETCHGKP